MGYSLVQSHRAVFLAQDALLFVVLFPLLHQAGELALDADFGDGVEAVDEEDAVEVIDLVLESAGEEAVGFHGDGFTVEVGVGDFDLAGSAYIAAEAGEAEAAFFADLLGAAEFELGIHEHDGHVLGHFHFLPVDLHEGDAVGIVGDVDDGELHIHGDLRSGETDAIGLAHRFQHVGGQGADIGRDFSHGAAFGTEHGFRIADDFTDHILL